jgi:hypothetical protein
MADMLSEESGEFEANCISFIERISLAKDVPINANCCYTEWCCGTQNLKYLRCTVVCA